MTPLTEIGECLISTKRRDYLFRPSFAAMARIGSPEEIVRAFYDINHDSVTPLLSRAYEAYGSIPAWLIEHVNKPQFAVKAISAAISVIQACCEDDCSELTGELVPSRSRTGALVWRSGSLSFEKILLVAQSLITHGVIGKAKTRQLQRNEGKEASTEFFAIEYINSARTHFGMTREEAERLTMTEFTMLINSKYPPEKGFTRDEYDAVMDEDDRKWQEMIDKQVR
ncbi:DUF6246 family protein [uncultured Cedecea sp.]|uniref:DUF6246 family protein n=1 Tax=uncultured Cedecea sp. TaxID=988762 RepID=UPI002612C9E3|nr:DUF6246 family protein [uncultured Cedecea sp.]